MSTSNDLLQALDRAKDTGWHSKTEDEHHVWVNAKGDKLQVVRSANEGGNRIVAVLVNGDAVSFGAAVAFLDSEVLATSRVATFVEPEPLPPAFQAAVDGRLTTEEIAAWETDGGPAVDHVLDFEEKAVAGDSA